MPKNLMSKPAPTLSLGDLRYPLLAPLWKEAGPEQRQRWLSEIRQQDRLAARVLGLLDDTRTLSQLQALLHHQYAGYPTSREIEQAIRFLQDPPRELVARDWGRVTVSAEEPVLPVPMEPAPDAAFQLQNTVSIRFWRLVDRGLDWVERLIKPDKEPAKLPEPEAAPAPISIALPAGQARIPRRPDPTKSAAPAAAKLRRHYLRVITAKLPALNRKQADESFLLDQPVRTA